MPMVDLRINGALDETFADFAAYLARRFTAEIREAKWNWPTDPSPRDIVDTGNLAKSLRVIGPETVDSRIEIRFEWAAPYAAPVHDGAVFKRTGSNGQALTMPARPWTRPRSQPTESRRWPICRRDNPASTRRVRSPSDRAWQLPLDPEASAA